jgi:hypothetical protein
LNHAKMTRLRDCTTTIMSRIFMPEAWSPDTHKSNEISWDGVFAEHCPTRRRKCLSDLQ